MSTTSVNAKYYPQLIIYWLERKEDVLEKHIYLQVNDVHVYLFSHKTPGNTDRGAVNSPN